MNKKAEFNLQGMLIGTLTAGLFFAFIGIMVLTLGGYYDTTGYDASKVEQYNLLPNVSERVQSAYESLDVVTVDPNLFDYLAGLFNKVIAPFKFIYQSFSLLFGLTGQAVADLNLHPIIGTYISALLIILVVIGIVMIKFYLNRNK